MRLFQVKSVYEANAPTAREAGLRRAEEKMRSTPQPAPPREEQQPQPAQQQIDPKSPEGILKQFDQWIDQADANQVNQAIAYIRKALNIR